MAQCIEDDPRIGDVVRGAICEWQEPIQEDGDRDVENYRRYVLRKWVFTIGCAVVAFIIMGVALTIGETPISVVETYQTIFYHIMGDVHNTAYDYFIIELRMPRIVIGLIAGAGLAVCGAVMQSIMMNPLTDPYTTGVSSGAMFGVTISMVLGFSLASGQMGILANAFIFALIPTAIMIAVSKIKDMSPTILVMAGIAVMYVFDAMTTMIKLWATDSTLSEIYIWSVGSLTFAGWEAVPYLLGIVVPGILIMMVLSRQINVLTTGDENATAMGVNVNQVRRALLVVIALVASTIVAFTGLIGFVGLIAPHVCRIFVGADNRFMIPASAMFGAMMLILADLIGRTIIAPSIIQVGVITSFLGGPMFLWLLLRKGSKVW